MICFKTLTVTLMTFLGCNFHQNLTDKIIQNTKLGNLITSNTEIMNFLQARDQVLITDDNVGPVIGIVTILCLILAILSVCARIYTKTSAVRKLSLDDWAVFFSMAFFIAQTVVILVGAFNGLGKRWDDLTSDQQNLCLKLLYAAGILTIPTLVSIKISIILFIRGLGPMQVHAVISKVFGVSLLVWGVASVFGWAFQCHAPFWRPIDNVCPNILPFWNSVSSINVITDVLLILWPSWIVWNLHAALSRRVLIISLFSTRFLVIACTATQLVFTNSDLASDVGSDPSFNLWKVIVCVQILLATSIMTACIPYLLPFLESLESGMLGADDLRRRGKTDAYGYGTAERSKDSTTNSGNASSLSKKKNRDAVALQPVSLENNTSVQADGTAWADGQSTSSQARIIHYEQTWGVGYENRTGEEIEIDGNPVNSRI
ncbi:hypothetical protein G7Y89_g8316 [Cudoniella acicularis]|uniref:Rhodopsin domain-containing protein n=1 Tax=Cudoniella acicularis TaxID=354080 RepID=A0A8H4RJ44_9HELO|nr:hypothetical protein G7Y89_g8316 [Cudoniella acicularis]